MTAYLGRVEHQGPDCTLNLSRDLWTDHGKCVPGSEQLELEGEDSRAGARIWTRKDSHLRPKIEPWQEQDQESKVGGLGYLRLGSPYEKSLTFNS